MSGVVRVVILVIDLLNLQTMKSFESPSASEQEKLQPERAVAQERGVLDRFRGKAKEIAGVMMMLSALSVMPGIPTEAYAEKRKQPTQAGQIQKNKEQHVNEAKLTASSTWAGAIMESMRADMGKIKTAEDADWLMRSHFRKFISEYYFPTEGNVKEGAYGVKVRHYSPEDAQFVLKNAQEMKQMLQDLNMRYGMDIELYGKRLERIDDMIGKLERKSSYSYQKRQEELERLEESLRRR